MLHEIDWNEPWGICRGCGKRNGWIFREENCPGPPKAVTYDFSDVELTVGGVTFTTKKIAPKPACVRCAIELSPELDAYYGRDAYLGKLCSKCRSKK